MKLQVKIRSDHLIVNETIVPIHEISKANWVRKFTTERHRELDPGANRDDSGGEQRRKRARTENSGGNLLGDPSIPSTSGTNQGNAENLLRQLRGGGSVTTRSRSNSRGSLSQTQT